jgi:hypothetical protein
LQVVAAKRERAEVGDEPRDGRGRVRCPVILHNGAARLGDGHMLAWAIHREPNSSSAYYEESNLALVFFLVEEKGRGS